MENFKRRYSTSNDKVQTISTAVDECLKSNLRAKAQEIAKYYLKVSKSQLDLKKLINIHNYYKSIGCFDLAVESASALARFAEGSPQTLAYAGTELGALRIHNGAFDCFQKLKALAPNNAVAHFLLGTAANACNKVELAKLSLLKAIKLSPNFFPAYLSYSQLSKQSSNNNNIELLLKKVHPTQFESMRFINFALAKEFDDLNNVANAMQYLEVANRSVSERQPYYHEIELKTFNAIKKHFSSSVIDDLNDLDNCTSDSPIFIVGMPRSGTTLLERMISVSNDTQACGELHDFIGQMVFQNTDKTNRSNLLSVFDTNKEYDLKLVGINYVQAVRDRAKGKRSIDKMPFNFRFLGYIVKAVPNCKIIHIKRQPQAVLLSNYQQNYKDSINLWSYDKNSAVKYYKLYQDYMEYWSGFKFNNMLEVDYEDLISNPEFVSKLIYNHCNLEWSTEVLSPNKQNIHSATQSAAQVREPIYSSSVYKWERYMPFFQEWEGLKNE
ncbi:MAG: sulfotransferase [Kangiellaceae bacterium]|nr:sulfotransferase [Kangiellaceae bacterium]